MEGNNEAAEDSAGIRVFVYGTLKQGYCNHGALETATYLGSTTIVGEYGLLDLGFYPAVVPMEGSGDHTIHGEVDVVDEDTLYTLDCSEGHPAYYERVKVDTEFKKAWVYMLPQDYLDRGYTRLVDGRWGEVQEGQTDVG